MLTCLCNEYRFTLRDIDEVDSNNLWQRTGFCPFFVCSIPFGTRRALLINNAKKVKKFQFDNVLIGSVIIVLPHTCFTCCTKSNGSSSGLVRGRPRML